jgi:hypothetical protein
MNRLLTSATLLITLTYCSNTCFAQETTSLKQNTIISSETADLNKAETVSETFFLDDYQEKSKRNKLDSAKPKQKEEDKSWVESHSGTKLNGLKSCLEELQNTYNINYRAFCIGNAINNTDKAESQQKRNAETLLNINRQSPFSINAAYYIFPEFLKLKLQAFSFYLLETEKKLTDEISETPEEINKIIDNLSDEISKYTLISSNYKKIVSKIQNHLKYLRKINTKPNNLTSFGVSLKKNNNEILNIADKQSDYMAEIVEQLDLAIDYCEKQIKFIKQHNHSISLKVKYIAEIRSSFKDLENFLENYENKQKYETNLLINIYTEFHKNLKESIGNEEIRSGRIKSFIRKSDFIPIPKTFENYNAKSDLEGIFSLFDLTEIDQPLYSTLLPYINGESWQSRYKEEEKKKDEAQEDDIKTKLKNKIVPKLIDFEED